MIAEIELPRYILKEILDTIEDCFVYYDKVGSIDIYIKIRQNSIQIYKYGPDLVSHDLKLKKINYNINENINLSLNSAVLKKIIQKASADKVKLTFFKEGYKVIFYEDYFSSPTTFNLKYYPESKFKEIPSIKKFSKLANIETKPLYEEIELLNVLSNVIKLSLKNSDLILSVADEVDGDGKVMKELDSTTFSPFSLKYTVRPIKNFLKNLKSSANINLYLNEDDLLMIEGEDDYKKSTLKIGHRID